MLRGRAGRFAAVMLVVSSTFVFAYAAGGSLHPAIAARMAQRSSAEPRHAAAYRIAFFGDSVSEGVGASSSSHGYIALVSRSLRARGLRVSETVDAKGGVPVAYWQLASIPKKLNAAVIELGTNDVHLRTPVERFAQEYRTLTSRILATQSSTQVLCLSVWSHPAEATLDNVINAQIRALCPGTYVDITSFRDRANIRASDGFHPNDVGYRLIAQAVSSRLKRN